MSTKKISAGDTLTVGDLTDDHLGAFIAVGPEDGITSRLKLDRVRVKPGISVLWTVENACRAFAHDAPVTVITPPPVVQPDAPTDLGQCIRIEGLPEWLGMVVDPPSERCWIRDTAGGWWYWDAVLEEAGDRQIIVSDPPRWPDETPDAPERIETREEWDALDADALREWEWVDVDGDPWWWDAQVKLWRSEFIQSDMGRPLCGPWTRGERVE